MHMTRVHDQFNSFHNSIILFADGVLLEEILQATPVSVSVSLIRSSSSFTYKIQSVIFKIRKADYATNVLTVLLDETIILSILIWFTSLQDIMKSVRNIDFI